MINTCVQNQRDEDMICDLRSPANVKQSMNIPDAITKSMALNLLSKETLEIIRKVTSNKPTPSIRPSLSYSFSNKRVNSDKPTPCLDSKIAEIRNGGSFMS
jgi:hypothetical protein